MNKIIKSLDKALQIKQKRNWDRIYVAVDLHDTVLFSNYKRGDISKLFYPYAKESLKLMSDRGDIILIMYTCSYPHEIDEYLEFFKEFGIKFDYVNSNPEVKTQENGYGYFEDKFYFNVLFDDKAGFSGNDDWLEIYNFLKPLNL